MNSVNRRDTDATVTPPPPPATDARSTAVRTSYSTKRYGNAPVSAAPAIRTERMAGAAARAGDENIARDGGDRDTDERKSGDAADLR